MPEHFRLVEVAAGVHAAVVDLAGAAVGNAAIVDTGDRTVVVDTFMTIAAADELRSVATELTGRTTFLTVNSHWHDDHVGGNTVFDDGPIVSTARTAEIVAERYPPDLAAYEREIDAAIEQARSGAASDDEATQASAVKRLETLGHVKDSIPRMRLTLPDVLVDDAIVLEDERRVEIRTLGPGHTDSDTFVWLPDDGIVIAADLCWVELHPKMDHGHPEAWAATADALVALGGQTVVPGHGDPSPIEGMALMGDYLRHVASALAGLDPDDAVDEIPVPPGTEAWRGTARYRAGLAALHAG